MARPLDAITAFHNAFRRDMHRIDQAALTWARGTQPAPPDLERRRFFQEILLWHANGEEAVVFPFIEREAPLLSEPYIQDHHGLDSAYEALHRAVEDADPLEAARASAAFRFHLDMHLAKEDRQIYAMIKDRIRLPEERGMMGTIAGMVPRERFPEVVTWIFPLLGSADTRNLLEVFQMLMPPEVFAGVESLVKKTLGEA